MKQLYICASPLIKGTSNMLLERVQQNLPGKIVYLYREDMDYILKKMREAQSILLSGPCYINSYPSRVTELFEEASKEDWQGKKLYGIINGGMPYVHTHEQGLVQLELFAKSCGFQWMGGFVLGVGAMLAGAPLEKHIGAKKLVPAFDAFAQHIAKGEPSPRELYIEAQPKIGSLMARMIAAMMNVMINRRLRKQGHDPKEPYSYR